MIYQSDIIKIAEQYNVPKSTIDKDWALGHVVDAIFQNEELRDVLIFKGGTCLRKCWFDNYRFSEDLDFTSRDPAFVLTEKHLQDISSWLLKNVGLQTLVEPIDQLRHKDQQMGYQAHLKFWGADHTKNEPAPPPARWQTRIKIEITLFELMMFPPEMKIVSHPYPDQLTYNQPIPCYALGEVVAEKLRALIQRSYTAPRDFFDIWYILKNKPEIFDESVKEAFLKKLAFKGYEFTGVDQLINPRNNKKVKQSWKQSLGHQIKDGELPEIESVVTFIQDRLFEIFQ